MEKFGMWSLREFAGVPIAKPANSEIEMDSNDRTTANRISKTRGVSESESENISYSPLLATSTVMTSISSSQHQRQRRSSEGSIPPIQERKFSFIKFFNPRKVTRSESEMSRTMEINENAARREITTSPSEIEQVAEFSRQDGEDGRRPSIYEMFVAIGL